MKPRPRSEAYNFWKQALGAYFKPYNDFLSLQTIIESEDLNPGA